MKLKTLLLSILFALTLFGCATPGVVSSNVHMEPASKSQVEQNFSKITNGMTDTKVRSLLGYPDDTKSYMTGKAWIPFYFGPDTSRIEYIYEQVGYVTFSRNAYSQSLKVIAKGEYGKSGTNNE